MIAEAVGFTLIVGVALPTVSITSVVVVVYLSLSVGVKVTEYSVESLSNTSGSVVPVVQENIPVTLAVPPDKVESESACPYVIAEAVGFTLIEGVSFPTADDV